MHMHADRTLIRTSLHPTVPSPAPPGSDSALDMHTATDMPYSSDACGMDAMLRAALPQLRMSVTSATGPPS